MVRCLACIFNLVRHQEASKMAAELRALVRGQAPPEIDELWAEESVITSQTAVISHMLAQQLWDWNDANEKVNALLRDKVRLAVLVTQVAEATQQLGMLGQQLQSQIPTATWVAPCLGCNTPNDSGGCTHDNRPFQVRIPLDGAAPWHRIVRGHLHRATKLLALTANLLSREDCDDLVQLISPQPPPGVTAMNFTLSEANSGKKGYLCIVQLFALLDNASTAFPKAVHYAAACFSLAVCHRPVRAFAQIDASALCEALYRYLEHIFDLIHKSSCLVEENYGLSAFINILPLLYWMADWKQVRRPMVTHLLPTSVSSILLNLVHSQNVGADDDRIDAPYDLEHLPELSAAIVFIEPLMQSNVLREHPMSWAIAATFEVLAKWVSCGIPVGTETIPTTDAGPEPIADCIQEYIPRLHTLAPDARRIAVPLATALASGDTTSPPSEELCFLRKPLARLARRCAFCGTTQGNLNRCGEACGGLALYCSKAHQKQLWAQHKEFCKLQRH